MTKTDPEREERRRRQEGIADRLKSSGALDEIFAKIDAGEPLTGEQGLLGACRDRPTGTKPAKALRNALLTPGNEHQGIPLPRQS